MELYGANFTTDAAYLRDIQEYASGGQQPASPDPHSWDLGIVTTVLT